MVFIQTILIVILVYYALKLLGKWLAPKLFNYAVKKTNERFGQEFGNYQDFTDQRESREGETTISKKPPRRANPSKKVGEYIDFEEID